MGHPANWSSRKRHALLLADPVAHFAGWLLSVRCAGCKRLATYPVRGVLDAHGSPDLTVAQLAQRLRCRAYGGCGGRPSNVWLHERMADRAGVMGFGRTLTVVGPAHD